MLGRRMLGFVLAGCLLASGVSTFVVPPTAAATAEPSPMIYVDGKIGFDPAIGPTASLTWGRSKAEPFKTVERALEETRYGLPSAIRIKGYTDYVYHETITRDYPLNASLASPLVIGAYTAAEDAAAAGIRPMIDGGLDVGRSGWHRPNATIYPHVWCKTWNPPGANLVTGQKVVPGYDSSLTSTRQDRLYFDTSEPLNRPVAAPTMAQLNAQPYSEYWNASKSTDNLCVHLGHWDGSAVDENPGHHTIVVPWYRGIIVGGGSSGVTIRDLRIRHTIMGVGFSVNSDPAIGKAHDNTAANVDSSYNYRMGFWTAGDRNTFDHVSGSRNSIQLVKLDSGTYQTGAAYGAQDNLVRNARAIQNLSHGVKLYGPLVQGNRMTGSLVDDAGIPVAAHSADQTQGVQLSNGASRNTISGNTFRSADAGVELYQYDATGGPLVGNVVTSNFFDHDLIGVFLWDSRIASSLGTGSMTFSHNRYYFNQVAIAGNGTTSGKVFDHESIDHAGYRLSATPSVDSAGVTVMTGSISITNSIISDTNGPSICPHAGATVSLSYTDTYAWRSDPRESFPHGTYCASTTKHSYGKVTVGSGVQHVAPAWNTDPASSTFLALPISSPLLHAASDGSGVGF